MIHNHVLSVTGCWFIHMYCLHSFESFPHVRACHGKVSRVASIVYTNGDPSIVLYIPRLFIKLHIDDVILYL